MDQAPGALVFFAVHNVSEANGPTELTCGSHLFSAAELNDVTGGQVTAEAQEGKALMPRVHPTDRDVSSRSPLPPRRLPQCLPLTEHHASSTALLTAAAYCRLLLPAAGYCHLQVDRTLSFKVPLEEGDIMVMDIRTQHHGTGNRLAAPRTVLYIQYVQDFFIDRGNFPEKQTPQWDALPNLAMQKLLSVRQRCATATLIKAAHCEGAYALAFPI